MNQSWLYPKFLCFHYSNVPVIYSFEFMTRSHINGMLHQPSFRLTRELILKVLALIFFLLAPAFYAVQAAAPFLYAAEGAKKIIQYDEKGAVQWEYLAEMSRDVWKLGNGNVLFCYNRDYNPSVSTNPSGVMEVTVDKKIVFHYLTAGQVWSCQRMADGNTLVGAASQGKLLIVNPAGKLVNEIKVLNSPGHSCMRMARQLTNGNFLVAEESAHAVREYTCESKLVREIKVSFAPFSAVRLDNGNTLVCGQQTMVEISPADEPVWSLQGKDIPQMGIRWFAGVQVLPNGNLFVCNAGGTVPFIEISRAHEIVWHSDSTQEFPLGHAVQRLDVPWPILK